MKITIEYCQVWNYEPRASGLAGELKNTFKIDPELIPSGGGVFEVELDGRL